MPSSSQLLSAPWKPSANTGHVVLGSLPSAACFATDRRGLTAPTAGGAGRGATHMSRCLPTT